MSVNEQLRRMTYTGSPTSGPGSADDERKALLQLAAMFEAYPGVTGLSHLMGLVIRDAIALRRIERDGWCVAPQVGGGWVISTASPTGGGDYDEIELARTRESLVKALHLARGSAASSASPNAEGG